MQTSLAKQMQSQPFQQQPPMPDRVCNCFESCEAIPTNDASQELVTVLTKLGYLEEISKEAIQKQKLQRIRSRLSTLKMGDWITRKQELRTGLSQAGIRQLFVGEKDFYDAVIIAWAAHADEEFRKKSRLADRQALATEFNVEKAEIKMNEVSGLPEDQFSFAAKNPQLKGLLYSLAMDWIEGGSENARTHVHAKEPPFQVRPSINAEWFFEKSGRHSHVGRGLVCFDSVLDAEEKFVTPERAESLMKGMKLSLGTFRDMMCHLYSPKTKGILAATASGRPIVSLVPKRGASIAAFSLSPAHGVTLDEAHAHGPGFPRRTRFVAVFSDYRIP